MGSSGRGLFRAANFFEGQVHESTLNAGPCKSMYLKIWVCNPKSLVWSRGFVCKEERRYSEAMSLALAAGRPVLRPDPASDGKRSIGQASGQ